MQAHRKGIAVPPQIALSDCQTLIQSLSNKMSIFYSTSLFAHVHETRGFVMYFASFMQKSAKCLRKSVYLAARDGNPDPDPEHALR